MISVTNCGMVIGIKMSIIETTVLLGFYTAVSKVYIEWCGKKHPVSRVYRMKHFTDEKSQKNMTRVNWQEVYREAINQSLQLNRKTYEKTTIQTWLLYAIKAEGQIQPRTRIIVYPELN